MNPTTHVLFKDIEGKTWHYSVASDKPSKPAKVTSEWVRMSFGERVHQILQERKKVHVTMR